MIVRSSQPESAPTIELTPIIDMVFLLLIFFLVATTYHQEERELEIALPQAESGLPISVALREIVVNVDEDGSITVGRERMDVERLRSIVADAVALNAEQKVTVRGDRDAPYASVARVLDVCKAAGIRMPFLDTVPMP